MKRAARQISASRLLTKTLPLPSKRIGPVENAIQLFAALRESRTLRLAVEYVRAEELRDNSIDCDGIGYAFAYVNPLAPLGEPLRERHDSEFHGGKSWMLGTREMRDVCRRVFSALLAWGILTEPYEYRGEQRAYAATVKLPYAAFIAIVRTLHGEGRVGSLLFDDPTWSLFGLARDDVFGLFSEADDRGDLVFQQGGGVTSIGMRTTLKNRRR